MADAQKAGVIDELFISLGLKTDSDSFKKGNDAVGQLKSGFLQIAALTGTSLGLKNLTVDLAYTVKNMEMLSRATGFTIDKLRFLKHAFVTAGLSDNGAEAFARQLKSIDLQIKSNTLAQGAYKSSTFIPQEYSAKYTQNPMEAMRYLISNLNQEKNEAIRNEVLNTLGITGESQEFFYNGTAGLKRAQTSWSQFGQVLPDGLVKDADIFIELMGILKTQFSQLSETLGADLLPIVNKFLKVSNVLVGKKYDTPEDMLVDGAKFGWQVVKDFFDITDENNFRSIQESGDTGSLWDSIVARWEAGGNYDYGKANNRVAGQRTQSAKKSDTESSALFAELENKHGLPAGLLNSTYQTESGGGKHLYSKAGALGPFQFMPDTAKDMGLEGDDVFDLEKSAEAAARYYKILLRRYNGDVAKAAAAYNHGMGNIDKKGLSGLPGETRNYIPKVLGGLDDTDYLADYNYRRNQPPAFERSRGGNSITVQQTNHSTIHAAGADADEVGRILQNQQAASLEQALAQTNTEKY